MIDFIKKHYLLNLIIVATFVTMIFFGWTIFKGYFFSDDFTWLWHGEKISNLHEVLQFKMASFYSPVMNLIFAILVRLFSYVAWPYFLLNFVIHIMVAVVVGMLCLKIFENKHVAWFSTLIFALAGGAYEPIIWIGANLHIIAVLFILLGLLFYINYWHKLQIIYLFLSIISFGLSLLTKEIAIVGFVLLLLVFWYLGKYKKCWSDLKLRIYWILIFVFYGVYSFFQWQWQTQSYWLSSGTWDFNLKYLFKIPLVILDVVLPYTWVVTMLNYRCAVICSLVILLFVVIVFLKIKQRKSLSFILLWMVVSIMPTIFFQTINWWEPLASRYTYLPRVGLSFGLALVLFYLWQQKKLWVLILVVGVIVYGQIFAVYSMVTKYPFVYNTGKSLVKIIEQGKATKADSLCFLPGRPFESNRSYIVGAAFVVANYNENAIIFAENVSQCGNAFIIKWDNDRQSFIKYD